MFAAIDDPFAAPQANGAAPSQANSAPTDDPFAAPNTNNGATPTDNTPPDSESFFPTTAAGVNKQVADFVPGLVKGAGQTVHTVSNLINKIPYVGETLAPKAGVEALNTMTTPKTTGEKIGVGAEGLGEFLLGDEALKGLSLAEKAGILAKVAKVAETHPTVAKMIEHGLTAVRGGVATSGEELAKGASPKEAAIAGASATGLGALAGAATEAVGSKLLVSKALKAAAKAEPDAVTATNAAKSVQEINQSVTPKLTSDIHSVLDDAAKTAGLPASTETAASKKALEVSTGIKAQAQQTYQQLDKLSGGTYQRFRDTIDGLKDAIKTNAHVNPDAVEAYKTRLKVAEDAFQETQKQLISQGVDPNVIKQADAQWRQAKSLEDFSKKLRSAEMLSGEMKPGTAQIDTGLKNLKPGRLESAVGPKGAASVRQSVIGAGKGIASQKAETKLAKQSVAELKEATAKAQKEIATIRTRQKYVGGALAGAAGVAGLGRKIAGEVIGGGH